MSSPHLRFPLEPLIRERHEPLSFSLFCLRSEPGSRLQPTVAHVFVNREMLRVEFLYKLWSVIVIGSSRTLCG